MKKDIFKVIEGERIDLQPLIEEHLDEISIIESDEELWRYEEHIETDRDKVKEIFRKRIDGEDVFDFIITRKSDGAIMGAVYTWSYSKSRKSWEIGYVLKPEFRGRGYCHEGIELLNNFIFRELNAHKIVGMCNGENKASAIVMERAGMSCRGVFKEEYLCGGRWVDQHFYSILEDEFEKRNKQKK